MTTFYLIRHGMTDLVRTCLSSHTPGISLNDEGRAQARAMADSLDGIEFAAIYSSPLERARETAQTLADRRKLEIEILPAFIEFDFGQWTLRPFTELDRDPEWKRFNSWRSTLRAPGGESILDVQARAIDAMEKLAARHPGERIAVVTHADVIRAILTHVLAMPSDAIMRLDIAPTSVSIVEYGEWGPRIRTVNRRPGWPSED